ncbi:MAG TPA: universal stress protein [Candidatus Korarchaeota archaeon]|nr:universal stress protein [Candidatus Korarchaeota archaeon]
MSESGKRVLVLLDEPVSAECLVGLLAGTLGLTSAEVTLLHVVTVPRTSPLEVSALREPSREALEWLDALASRLAEQAWRPGPRWPWRGTSRLPWWSPRRGTTC